MLNFIRVVLIGFMVLAVAGCTTVKAKSGFSVRVSGYEFTCTTEPKQKLLNKELAKSLAEKLKVVAATLGGTTEIYDATQYDDNDSPDVVEIPAMMFYTDKWIRECKRLVKISAKH